MAFIQPSDVEAGKATKASSQNAQSDALASLNATLSGVAGTILANGSFEFDLDADGEPDSWSVTDFSGGTHEISDLGGSGDAIHGRYSLRCIPTATSGRVEALSDDFIAIAAAEAVTVYGFTKASIANITHDVQVIYYDEDQSLVSADTIVDIADTPTAWNKFVEVSIAPATAVFFKVKLLGGDGTVAGSIYFDGVGIDLVIPNPYPLVASGPIAFASGSDSNFIEDYYFYLPDLGYTTLNYRFIMAESNGPDLDVIFDGNTDAIAISDGTKTGDFTVNNTGIIFMRFDATIAGGESMTLTNLVLWLT